MKKSNFPGAGVAWRAWRESDSLLPVVRQLGKSGKNPKCSHVFGCGCVCSHVFGCVCSHVFGCVWLCVFLVVCVCCYVVFLVLLCGVFGCVCVCAVMCVFQQPVFFI